ncbi:MAG TPA: 2-hydroxyacyl-CoA dehydratase family protein [Spirochaetota bacterium]|nr:MAG: R-phenyllactate dehydratase subunit alpha precursor [Spirochaetes bacterium ADurb.BinA120]HNU92684.1 2-hydroxyacyl-CoA dehydratase family protein [Spirochaetota bacterium]HPI14563.1 2-hydroxyacyl-CoA dehydratase family protein [Spirochaetota bacterium]HPO46204.1 2-hydroxyacyl-CoA dehydratase family protein [Spirochaetota bacterium]HPV98737.1 2-hydroxyacyl-CoA dehydratase family protein [Spirochaetota bacterium]
MSEEQLKKDPEKEKMKVKSVKKMKEIMTAYYIDAKTASQNGKKVGWITSGGPVEPIIVMDAIPVYPENHGAMIGAAKMGVDLCEKAEDMGYCRDLCSYARSDIAASLVNGGPIGGLPAPDFLVCGNNICGTVLKWYEIQARYYKVPLFIFDTPFCHTEFSSEAREYVRRQIDEYIKFLEEVCGKKFDMDRMKEVGRLSLQGQRLWQEVLDTSMNKPAPLSAFDAFFHLALIVTLRGTQTAVDYYVMLLEEMKERAAQKIGSIPNERYRLLWDNLPVWYKTRWLSEKFASYDACLVADTYTTAWCGSLDYLDENDFLGSMVEGYTRIYLNIGVDEMLKIIKKMIKKYEVDGFVMHSNRSCKPYSLGQYDIMKTLQKEMGLPSLMIEADMVDERSWSESQIETRIDAFMEIIKQKKG